MERIVEQTLLYDFYGELLNEHQRSIYEDAFFNDLSLSEIADEYGISRQGVHDLIKRVTKTLEGYESKLHLIDKFLDTKEKVSEIDKLVDSYIESKDMNDIHKIKELSNEILEDF
ncbi:MAG: sigma factor-like helix-turn-helix DNA-binding protein [Eubacteriales bacterium]|nr:sigma factor-like helix-turn-helix DNA-binding protein [Eubacteriales bacterium]